MFQSIKSSSSNIYSSSKYPLSELLKILLSLQGKDGENKSNGIGDGVGDGHDDDGRGGSDL